MAHFWGIGIYIKFQGKQNRLLYIKFQGIRQISHPNAIQDLVKPGSPILNFWGVFDVVDVSPLDPRVDIQKFQNAQ